MNGEHLEQKRKGRADESRKGLDRERCTPRGERKNQPAAHKKKGIEKKRGVLGGSYHIQYAGSGAGGQENERPVWRRMPQEVFEWGKFLS